MGIGVRLGPFRIGVSSRGRVTGGVSIGPVSASTRLGGGQQNGAYPIWPDKRDQLVAQAEAEGWRVVAGSDWHTRVERGWRAAVIATVQGGTQIRPALSERAIWGIAYAAIGIAGLVFFSVLL